MPLKPKSKKRGSKSADFEEGFSGDEKDLSKIIGNNIKYFGVKRPQSPEEVAERIANLFEDCFLNKSLPTVEKLALCLGINRRILWEWENTESQGKEVANMIKGAKEIMSAIDAEAVSLGLMNTVAYIFRAKNFYGMTDNATIEVRATPALGETADRGEIAQQLLRSIGTTLTEGQATIPMPSDYASGEPATMPSDYSAGGQATMPSDYHSEMQATINPASDYQPKKASDYPSDFGEIIDVEPIE